MEDLGGSEIPASDLEGIIPDLSALLNGQYGPEEARRDLFFQFTPAADQQLLAMNAYGDYSEDQKDQVQDFLRSWVEGSGAGQEGPAMGDDKFQALTSVQRAGFTSDVLFPTALELLHIKTVPDIERSARAALEVAGTSADPDKLRAQCHIEARASLRESVPWYRQILRLREAKELKKASKRNLFKETKASKETAANRSHRSTRDRVSYRE